MAIVSTRGRYALRVMIDLAEHNTGEYITLMDIAQRQEISEKYLEGIVAVLSKKGFLQTLRGRGGGYKLARDPESYTVLSILRLTETSLAPVSCLEEDAITCHRAGNCHTLPMWTELNRRINDYLGSITLASLVEQEDAADNYVI